MRRLSHHWARLLSCLGHEVKLIAPQLTKPYVKRGKNDAADAEALCEAMSRPTMRFVPVKTADQQAALMLAGMRERLIRNRTQLANAIRGFGMEFGIVAASGMCRIEPLLERIAGDQSLPDLARELFAVHGDEYRGLLSEIKRIEEKLMDLHRADECSRRLAEIPGVGPVGASLLMMKTPDPRMFKCGRDWIGLTPKDHSTAGKVRLGGITRASDEMLRSVLVVGAKLLFFNTSEQAKADMLRDGSPNCCNGKSLSWLRWRSLTRLLVLPGKLMVSGETYRRMEGQPKAA